MTKNIFIIRHGETEFNRLGIIQGSGVNSSLNDMGVWQANAFYDRYQDIGFEVVMTSDLVRTHETVAPFIEAKLPWEQFSELDEISWGIHEGKSRSPELKAEYQVITDAWAAGDFDTKLPEGESPNEVLARMNRFIEGLRERKEKNILVCSHGRAMRVLNCALLNTPLYKMEEYSHSNTGLYKYKYENGEFILELANNTKHLELARLKI